ncbi:MAG TPA: ABC transporter permease [Candidatus Angelobacter sp.]|nr:ABC transporter permease [Candidatus Angelobacter sp.]
MQSNPQIRSLIWQSTFLLRTASLLVPKQRRASWYQEWHAEVWHWLHFLAESGRLNQQTTLELVRHCWGAFPDALWHRFDRKKTMALFEQRLRSARFCMGTIAGGLIFLVLITGFAPTIRSQFKPLPFTQPERLAYFSMQGYFSRFNEESLFRDTARWVEHSKTVEAIASYSWYPAVLALPKGVVRDFSARVSANFFQVLGNKAELGRVFVPGDEVACPHCVVITDRLWKSQFASDPNIVGRTFSLDGRESTIIGVLPQSFVFTFPEVSIWMPPHWDTSTQNLTERTGAVLRLKQQATLAQAGKEFHEFAENSGYGRSQMESFTARAHQGTKLYLFFCALSLLGGIALGSRRLAGAKTSQMKLSRRDSLRWWGFFLAKTLLLLAVCFVAALEITGRVSIMLTGSLHPLVGPASTWLFLVTAMIALSWSLHDQGRRCRFCLNRLGHEASVGTPGYLLLDWWGTELVCSDGHGLLHVPEMKSSWQEFDQWVSLDESWKALFEHEQTVSAP